MNNTIEFNSSIDQICRLCAMQQDNGLPLFVGGSEELDNLVKTICFLLGLECKDSALHPKWLCSSCQIEARSTEQFIQLVHSGQKKLTELLSDCTDDLKKKEFTDTVTAHNQTGSNAERLQSIMVSDRKRCTKYKKRIKHSQKVECIEKPDEELDAQKKRTRRRPQRLLEEIEFNASAKRALRALPPPVQLDNQIDSCTLITSQPIAELRTATGNALGEFVEVESNKDKENQNIYKTISNKTYFICEYCKAVFPRQNAFLKHIETHKNCIYECNECLQTFSSKKCFSQHQTMTGHAGVGIIEDIGAEKDVVHKSTEHSRLTGATSSEAINIVVGANGQITSIDEMDSSGRSKTNDSLAEETPDEVLSTEDTSKIQYNGCAKKLTNRKMYACLACTKTFDCPYAVKRHYKLVHVAERVHKCSLCPAAFKTKYNYDLHLSTHTGEKHFTCNFCPKSFKTKHERKVHNRVHTGEKPFKCLHCLKTFANRCNLVTHKRVHTGERPYKCSNCEAAYTTSSHLKKHKQMHLRKAQYKLKVEQESKASQKQSTPKESNFNADVAATQALVKLNCIADKPLSLLKSNIRNKNSVKSKVVCSELSAMPCKTNVKSLPAITANSDSNVLSASCIKSFQNEDLCRELPRITNVQILPAIADIPDSPNLSMVNTSNTITENLTSTISADSVHAQFKFQCPSCQKKFKQSCALRKHQRTHTGERPYKCPMCPKSFADPSNFKKHRMLHKNATHALKNIYASKSSTMQELRQMLAEQSVIIKQPHATQSSTYAASDPDPDGLETFSRSLACASDFADAAEILNEHNSSFSAALGNFVSWNRFENALPPADMAFNNSLLPFTDTAVEVEESISGTARANQLVCISYQDPINPVSKTTTYYVVN